MIYELVTKIIQKLKICNKTYNHKALYPVQLCHLTTLNRCNWWIWETFLTVEFVCTLLYLCCQLMKIGLINVHGPAAMQEETTFVPPGQKR